MRAKHLLHISCKLHSFFSMLEIFPATVFHCFWGWERDGLNTWNSLCQPGWYSLHRKKVYTCGKAKYSKSRGARGKVGAAPHPPLSWSYFSCSPPQFWVLGSTKVYTFFWGRLYDLKLKDWLSLGWIQSIKTLWSWNDSSHSEDKQDYIFVSGRTDLLPLFCEASFEQSRKQHDFVVLHNEKGQLCTVAKCVMAKKDTPSWDGIITWFWNWHREIHFMIPPACRKRHFYALERCPCKEDLHENSRNEQTCSRSVCQSPACTQDWWQDQLAI